MANLQRWTTSYATGPSVSQYNKYIQTPNTTEEVAMCSQQRHRSNYSISFSGLGVILVLFFGSLAIVTSLILPIVFGWILKTLRKSTHRRTEWQLDEYLQLQRIAYDRSGKGTWQKVHSLVPITIANEMFGHPKAGTSSEFSASATELSAGDHKYEPLKQIPS